LDDLDETFAEYNDVFGSNSLNINKIYSWLEYSFDTSSSSLHSLIPVRRRRRRYIQRYYFSSQQDVTPQPKIYLSYELKKTIMTDEYELIVYATNVGEGPAYGLTVSPPNIFCQRSSQCNTFSRAMDRSEQERRRSAAGGSGSRRYDLRDIYH
jgi:hypothetical protein